MKARAERIAIMSGGRGCGKSELVRKRLEELHRVEMAECVSLLNPGFPVLEIHPTPKSEEKPRIKQSRKQRRKAGRK